MKFIVIKLIPILMVAGCITALYFFTVRTGKVLQYDVQSGVVDLTDVNPNSILTLAGEWHFKNKLITRYDEADKTAIVPHIWDNRRQGGFGSYALRILPKHRNTGGYALYFNRIGSAYRVLINGVLRLENGKVGTKIKQSIPHRAVNVVAFSHDTLKPIDIIIQVSNFHHPKGGMKSVVLFGAQNEIVRHAFLFKFLDILCIGGMVVIAFCHMFLFVYRVSDKEHLYISLLVLMLGFYLAGSGESILATFLPNLNYGLYLRLIHVALVFPLFLYNRLNTHLFPNLEIRALSLFVEVSAVLYTLFIIVAPVKAFTEYLYLAHVVVIVTILYRNLGLIRGIIQKNPEAFTVALGTLAFSVTSFIELAYINQRITNARVMPLGMLMLAISYNVIILERYLAKAERTVFDVKKKNKIVGAKLDIRESQLGDLWESVTQPNFISDMNKINSKLKEIAYFKGGRGLSIAFDNANNEVLDVSLTLTTIVKMFGDSMGFMRCHRSYIVNPNRVERITRNGLDKKVLILVSGIRIPAGPKYLDDMELLLRPAPHEIRRMA